MIAKSQQDGAARFVVPRWLDYKFALKSGELALQGDIYIPPCVSFLDEFQAFKESPNPGLGADLMGKAFLEDRREQRELAEYVARAVNIASPSRDLAKRILSDEAGKASTKSEEKSLEAQVSILRSSLKKFPRNPTKWVDLSRIYAALGLDRKAVLCFRTALALAPEDRFTVRAFSRFCIHTDQVEEALIWFGKNSSLFHDPWLLATAESLAKIDEKPSPLPRKLSLETSSERECFHNSELFEAFAMSELINGKDQRARRVFRKAWSCPSQNVVRHAEWVTRSKLPGLRGETYVNFGESREASAREAFRSGDFFEALRQCEIWRFEEPYSREPLAFESVVHCVLERFEQVAVCFRKAKERNLMSPTLWNNYVFSVLMSGDQDSGSKLLADFAKHASEDDKFLVFANRGLLALVSGEEEDAKEFYSQAEDAVAQRDRMTADRVFLHYCRARAKFGVLISKQEIARVETIAKRRTDSDIKAIVKHTLSDLNERLEGKKE